MYTGSKLSPTNKHYMIAVINILQEKEGLAPAQAKKLFLQYYRPLKRNWGHERNVEEFADKIINIARIVERVRTGEKEANSDGVMIEWKRV